MHDEGTEDKEADQISPVKPTCMSWYILCTFCLLSITNAIAWLTFAPVPFETAEYFDVKVNQVDLFSALFMLINIPLGLWGIYMIDRIGLKISLHIVAWANAVGIGLRLGTLYHDGTNPENCENMKDLEFELNSKSSTWLCAADSWTFPVSLAATVIAAIAQPFVLVLPTKIAAQWFPYDRRVLANSIASIANPLGLMLASLLGPIICKEPRDLFYLQLYYFIPAVVSLVMTWFILQEGIFPSAPNMQFSKKMKILFWSENSMNYLLVASMMMHQVGLTSMLLTLIVQFLCPRGYENTFSSSVVVTCMIVTGTVLSIVTPFFIDGTRRHALASKILLGISLFGLFGFNLAIAFPDNEVWIIITGILFGGGGLAAFPINNELILETTYPVGEATSIGIAIMSSQLLAIIYLAFSALPRHYDPPESICPEGEGQNFIWYLFGANCAFLLFYVIFVIKYRCDYKRQAGILNEEKKEEENTIGIVNDNYSVL